jgi:hypothetical protein
MEKEFDQRLKNLEIKKIKQFGYSFSGGMALLLLISLWKGFPFPVKAIVCFLSIYHLAFALFYYQFLLPTYHFVSFVTKQIGDLIIVLIFSALFYLIFTPISLILRLFKKDMIRNISMEPKWTLILEEKNDPRRVERLY